MKIKTLVVSLCLTLFSVSCNDSDNVVDPYSINNLIANYSFEKNGSASLEGWIARENDTNLINFSKDVPYNGGNYSLMLANAWGPPGFVSYEIPQQPGAKIYKLSAFVKEVQRFPFPILSYGKFGFAIMKADSSIKSTSITFSDSTWTARTIVDTIDIKSGEKLYVWLSGSPTQWGEGWAMFDLLKLEIQD